MKIRLEFELEPDVIQFLNSHDFRKGVYISNMNQTDKDYVHNLTRVGILSEISSSSFEGSTVIGTDLFIEIVRYIENYSPQCVEIKLKRNSDGIFEPQQLKCK